MLFLLARIVPYTTSPARRPVYWNTSWMAIGRQYKYRLVPPIQPHRLGDQYRNTSWVAIGRQFPVLFLLVRIVPYTTSPARRPVLEYQLDGHWSPKQVLPSPTTNHTWHRFSYLTGRTPVEGLRAHITIHTVKPVLRDHYHERPLVLKDH